ncbi:copper transporter [Nonomuraea sediminis]|uniref:copper transporter n=1 Tax=Nonomuraea sediminis TaxID=2835864 RepID=UPI001BDC5391|nr:copper transporter [Nonomuraea sediminis]
MIDFRYHLVSIVAIFLALAVGIIMGTTLLQEPAVELAKKTSDELTKTNGDLRTELDALRGREAGNDQFVLNQTPQLVSGDLQGQRVLLMDAPGDSATYREAQQQVIEQAGAVVSGRVSLSEKFFDPKSAGVIDGLVNTLKPASMSFPPTASVYDKAATLLAATTLTTDPAQANTVNPDTSAVLKSFETDSLLSTTDGDPNKRATMVVMFAPEKVFDGDNASAETDALVALNAGLDQGAKGSVLAGTAATAAATGGAVSALRDDSDAAKHVSTVDTLDMPAGRVVVVYALREQLAGKSGHYGIGAGASNFQPAVPNASTSPTSSGS